MKFIFIPFFFVFSYFEKIFIYSLNVYLMGEYFFCSLDSRIGIIDFNSNISYLNFINDSTQLDENNSTFLDEDLIINNLKKVKNISINNITVTQYNGSYNKIMSNYKNDSITFLIGLGNGSEFFNESYTLNKIENNKYEIKFDKLIDKTDKIVSINFKNNKINTENINLIINTYSIINIEPNITINLGKNNINFNEIFYSWYNLLLKKNLKSIDENDTLFQINQNNFKSLDRIGLKIDNSIFYFSTFELFDILDEKDQNYNITFKFNNNDLNFMINLGINFFSKFKIFNINYKENKIYLDSNSYFLNYSKYKNSFKRIKIDELNKIIDEKSLVGNKFFILILIFQIISVVIIILAFVFIGKDNDNKQ